MLRYLAELRSLPAAAAIAAGIFLIDTLTSLHFAVASLNPSARAMSSFENLVVRRYFSAIWMRSSSNRLR